MSPIAQHVKCRNAIYLHSAIRRLSVPDALVAWTTAWPAYNPPQYEAPVLATNPAWADPATIEATDDDGAFRPQWNRLDGPIDRRSHSSAGYEIDPATQWPRNPLGRTGLRGRGLLGRWGPNHAADPIITRWKPTETGCERRRDRRTLQMVAIRRSDTGQWAIPGGMVDPGETVRSALLREFCEEALSEAGPEARQAVRRLFAAGAERAPVYRGYVDDPRNTDNAWMETVACHFHDDDGRTFEGVHLRAGDDATHVRWLDVTDEMRLYASHARMVAAVAARLGVAIASK